MRDRVKSNWLVSSVPGFGTGVPGFVTEQNIACLEK